MVGRLSLIGCGPGDRDLLTLKALRTIQSLDVALVDHLLSAEILALIPQGVEVVYVGKRQGKHSMSQEAIHELIAMYVAQGHHVGRLKCGDPYIFGRGSEEARFAHEHAISTEVIAGLSSALAGALYAGIAPTARGVSHGVSIVSAHLSGHRLNLDWLELLNKENHTVIVLMALSRLRAIQSSALEMGIDPQLPCAIVSRATTPEQVLTHTTLQHLHRDGASMPRPGIVVFGNVTHLDLPH